MKQGVLLSSYRTIFTFSCIINYEINHLRFRRLPMKYLDYREKRQHGAFNFPIAYYSENPHAPRYVMPFHWHNEYELISVTEGTFPVTADGTDYMMHAGDCLLLPGGILHGGTPEECRYECIVFHPRMLLVSRHLCTPLIQGLINQSILLRQNLFGPDTSVAKISRSLCAYLQARPAGYEFFVQSCLYQLLGVLSTEHLLLFEETKEGSGNPEPVKNALSFIEAHYTEHIELEDISRAAGLNPNYLCRLFKNYTGRTPIDYLRSYRIECACEILATRMLSIPETAWRCGFHDPAYFSRCFKKEKGMTPTSYLRHSFT